MFGVYVRVSSKGQRTDSQIDELQRYLEGNGIPADQIRWYEDKESGKNLDRPAFKRLQADIFNGEIKSVICWKLDRIARSQRDGINLIHEWVDKGVRLVITTMQLDITGTVGRMVAGLMFALAELERENIRARQKIGIATAKRKAAKEGRTLYKGRKAGTTKAKPSRVAELAEKGFSQAEIATALGINARTVRRYLAASLAT